MIDVPLGIIGRAISFVVERVMRFFGSRRDRTRALTRLKAEARQTPFTNDWYEIVGKFAEFFRQHPVLLRHPENTAFVERWVMDPYLQFAKSTTGYWTAAKCVQFQSDVAALRT